MQKTQSIEETMGDGQTGKIFDIQKFSVNDGPGIRTLIFFKGCPLRCKWCSNPESQHVSFELLHYRDLCTSCGKCAEVCPNHCVQIDDGLRTYDKSGCIACGACVEPCPKSAIRLAGQDMTVEEIVSIVKQDYLFYLNSGGGATIGGGEPTMQPDFLHALLAQLTDIGIHTAMETCGYADFKIFERVSPLLDLFLFDVKHMDPEKHQHFTGKGNTPVLENLSGLLAVGAPIVVRIPLIHGFNDDPDAIRQICSFLASHDKKGSVKRVELLPYHKLGTNKYRALGRNYELEALRTPPVADIEALSKEIQLSGFESKIEYI
jgi:choline trimethylamine-lyase activating enzyme